MKGILRQKLEGIGRYGMMVSDTCGDILKNGIELRELSRQIVVIGTLSLPIVLLTAAFSGMVIALQTAYGLERFGGKNYVGNILGLSITRELGPVLSAVMVCGRVGAGIAAEIGSMAVTEQIDAIRCLGANPIRKLVAPRLLAGIIVLPLLVISADLIGIYGGALIAVYELNLSSHLVTSGLTSTLVIRDVTDGLLKSSLFGALLVSIACYQGLQTRGGTVGVGRATTQAVVIGSISIFIANFFATKLLFLL